VERELEEAPFAGLVDGGEHADDVAVAEHRPAGYPLQLVSAPEEGSVHAPAVGDEPHAALAFERTVAGAGDDTLRIGLKADVVQLREPSHRGARAGECDGNRRAAVGTRDDELRRLPSLPR
jgi:hypothetical protein